MNRMPESSLVGRVAWSESSIVAALFDDGSWSVEINDEDRPDMAAVFRARYGDEYAGPQDGRFGVKILAGLAERVGGSLVIEDPPTSDIGVIA